MTNPTGDPSLTRREFVQRAALTGVAGVVIAASNLKAADAKAAPSLQVGSDWPMYRHDPALTAESPLRGGLAEAPAVAWSLDLGGPKVPAESVVVRDVTGDGPEGGPKGGPDEFLTFSADTVACRDSRGKVLWKLDNFLNPTLLDVLDFAGDGSRGILLTTNRSGKIDTFMVNGRTGKAVRLWDNENNFGGHIRIGKLLPEVRGLQIAATASGQTPPAPQGGDVHLISFERGLSDPRFRIRQRVTGVFYSPLILLADLNGDGRDELVVISHEQIWAFDPASGERTFFASYGPAIRTYMATIAAIKLTPTDACPSLVMINHSLPGLKAVSTDGKSFARELWKDVAGGKEDQYQKRVAVNPAGTSLVYDLNRDGHYLIFASIKNEHDDGATHLVVFDTRTGKRLAELPEAQVLAADDLDGDGKQELLLLAGNKLSICRWQDGKLHTLWQEADVLPLVRPLPLGGDRGLFSATTPTAKGNSSVWREKGDAGDFLLRFPDGVFSCRLDREGLKKGDKIAQHEALGNLPVATKPDQVVWDGAKLVTLLDGDEIYRYTPPIRTLYLARPPLVADLAGQRRILIRDAAGKYLLCSSSGKVERVFLEQPYDVPELITDAAGVGPLICDVDGDGENEVVATVKDDKGLPVCVILDGSGKEKRRIERLPGMTGLSRGPTGRLGSDRGRWILLRMSGEGANHERVYQVAAYDGKTGKQLWTRTHYGHYGKNPVDFVAHFPGAVLDYDGDGADDWIVCSENFYGIVNVRENKDLVGPVILSDAITGHWTAYTFPSVAKLHADGKAAVLHHSAYSLALVTDLEGRPLWHFGLTRDTASTWGQLVDLDADGRREVLHAQPNGLLRCFTPGPPARCPICPPDSPLPASKERDERWSRDFGRPISRMIAADLDGDGRMEILFGCDDGKLYALGERDGKPHVLWSLSLGRRVGEPVQVDLDGDGRPEILVAAEDGVLYCLKGK